MPPQADLLGLGGAQPQEELLPGFPPGEEAPPKPQEKATSRVNLNLLDPTPPPSSGGSAFSFLADLGNPAPVPPAPQQRDQEQLSDLFGLQGGQEMAAPVLEMPRVTSSPNLQRDNNNFDPFSNLAGLTSSLSNHNLKTSPSVTPMRSMGGQPRAPAPTQPLDPFAGLAGLGGPAPAPRPAAAPAPQPMGPNYSRSFFDTRPPGGQGAGGPAIGPVGGKAKVSHASFGDLLGGFNPTARDVNQGKTIGQMKKADLVKTMDPDDALILDWREGKARNIRSLLCSLHKIIFPGTRWSECGMHQLVSQADVKKMYRKACLAVHPDKQMGTENENLSKLIFMELNEAWSEFDNDPSQQNIFG